MNKCQYFDTLNAENVSVKQSSSLCPATREFLRSTKRAFILVVCVFIIGTIVIICTIIFAVSMPPAYGIPIYGIFFAVLLFLAMMASLVLSSPKFLQEPYLHYADL
jgi:hypothetical protein